ncbi:MAG: acetyl-CoA carboxylase biotin carboxylase subunit [Ignavibacteriales bacterium]|nr:MAG: acetyl-CoA carboxylase biotin carboxylase subunit [Ignavibacteriales bacterium]
MIKKILIANRGEIAVRIIRACKELGITSVAVYSNEDKLSLHTKLADESYPLKGSTASETYLNKEKIFSTIEQSGADAIHPGYGFFSENADFIREAENRNIIFIGPSADSVLMMGSKTSARRLMTDHKVPVVPGTLTPLSSLEEGLQESERIGYPVLLKAAAGGGGKGMRTVFSKDEFISAYDATKREALKSFADDSVYIEKFILNPRHIEVQVIADKQGNYVHLFERECSIQRRHQKIIEEAPSAFIDSETRTKLTQAAINAAKACRYYNAGTIEFLVDSQKNFYFLEMNTRLQVEHPVTEFITGIDLVKEQISIANGNKLSFMQEDLKISGHAIECRVYAEDPSNNFLPSTGTLEHYRQPAGPGVRVDSGFESGSSVSIYFDPMIAKLICWTKERKNTIKVCHRALSEFQIAGVINNIEFLKSLLEDDAYQRNDISINYIEDSFLKNNGVLKSNDPAETAAAVLASLLKMKKNHKTSISPSSNKWRDQNYE